MHAQGVELDSDLGPLRVAQQVPDLANLTLARGRSLIRRASRTASNTSSGRPSFSVAESFKLDEVACHALEDFFAHTNSASLVGLGGTVLFGRIRLGGVDLKARLGTSSRRLWHRLAAASTSPRAFSTEARTFALSAERGRGGRLGTGRATLGAASPSTPGAPNDLIGSATLGLGARSSSTEA